MKRLMTVLVVLLGVVAFAPAAVAEDAAVVDVAAADIVEPAAADNAAAQVDVDAVTTTASTTPESTTPMTDSSASTSSCKADCTPVCTVDCTPVCTVDCVPACTVDCVPACTVDCTPCTVDCVPDVPECGNDCIPIDEPACIGIECVPDGGGLQQPSYPVAGRGSLPFTGIEDVVAPLLLGLIVLLGGFVAWHWASLRDAAVSAASSARELVTGRRMTGYESAMRELDQHMQQQEWPELRSA